MDWYDLTGKYHEMTIAHDGDLDSLPQEWQRELAAVWRLEADVNNGGYLQFLANWGVPSHHYSVSALQKMRAKKMAKLVSDCFKVLAAATEVDALDRNQLQALLPNPMIGQDGRTTKGAGSSLPNSVLGALNDLSYKFMDYPEDIFELGLKHYGPIAAD